MGKRALWWEGENNLFNITYYCSGGKHGYKRVVVRDENWWHVPQKADSTSRMEWCRVASHNVPATWILLKTFFEIRNVTYIAKTIDKCFL